MATGLTDGYIYFVESEAVGGDDWITDHAGNPDSLDLDPMTEGTEYCKLQIPQRRRKKWITGITVTDSGGGTSFDFRSGAKGYDFLAEGIESSQANADLVEKFFMIDRHTSGLAATFKNHYMIVRIAAATYVTFIDASDTPQKYVPIRSSGGEQSWSEDKPMNVIVRIFARSCW